MRNRETTEKLVVTSPRGVRVAGERIEVCCVRCSRWQPLHCFGVRMMKDAVLRNQPWCLECRTETSPRA